MFLGRLNILMQFFTKQRIEKQLQNWKILPLKFLIELSLTDRKLGLVGKKKNRHHTVYTHIIIWTLKTTYFVLNSLGKTL